MENFEVAKTPMNANEKLQKVDGSKNADGSIFRSMDGGLNYHTH